jgi:hypothetical protein
LQAHANPDTAQQRKFSNYEMEWVINKILPPARKSFHAGELDQLFQLRPRTRIDLHAEICGTLLSGRNSYARAVIADFLRRRWLGAVCSRNNFPSLANEACHPSALARAAGVNKPDTSKQTTHAPKSSVQPNRVPASPAAPKQNRNGFKITAPASLTGAAPFLK